MISGEKAAQEKLEISQPHPMSTAEIKDGPSRFGNLSHPLE